MAKLVIALLATLCAPALFAYPELAGKDAPAFHATVCVNPPADGCVSLTDCRGSVVLIKYWGPN